ncbi:MAG: sigma-70 family RNA polymerase sigma factor [Firmicutes bacterium]|nr:sigma-70 family RNA polymerase sigma factor [Bacillota bacterium]
MSPDRIAAAGTGDSVALAELFAAHHGLIGLFVQQFAGADDPEDLAQEARIALWQAARTWRPERGPFGAWAGRRIRAALRDRLRRHYRQRRSSVVPLTAPRDPDHPDLSWEAGLADSDPAWQPERACLARETQRALHNALRQHCTPLERLALTARLAGVPPRHLPLPAKTLDNAAGRARRKLRAALLP